MDIFAKFGICLICILALVLFAVTPSTATSEYMGGSLSEAAPASPSRHQGNGSGTQFALDMNNRTEQPHGS